AKLFDGYKSCFREWMFYLCSNFNLLLFGLGSKRQIIHSFCDSMLKNQNKLILNGFFPGLTIKSSILVWAKIVCNIMKCTVIHGNIKKYMETTAAHSQDEMLNTITKHYNSDDEKSDHLFLIIHNIDGAPLRTSNSQGALCKLADIKRIHIIASIDHINAPLAWDQSKLTRFRWLWHDVTTYASYTAETSYEGSLLLSSAGAGLGARGAALALSGLLHVAKSLTSNARGVFKILIEHQLEEKDEEETQEAFSFTDLYRICRERFLVNSELTLKAHLTEFVDHKLVNIHKGSDGGEYLSVPLDPTTLKEYLEYDFNQ
uniref:Origin recognition complex subunit 2 n=1 Tax=Ciona intestinalis TaxID=7719 RepID=F6R4H7_CIOIN